MPGITQKREKKTEMARYINTEEFEKLIKPYDTEDRVDRALYLFAHNKMICTPTADVVKVTQCKDCKHGRPYKHTKEYVSCEVDCDPIDRDSDFYCADGKRRE